MPRFQSGAVGQSFCWCAVAALQGWPRSPSEIVSRPGPIHSITPCVPVFIPVLTHSSSHACSYGIIFNSSFNNEIHRSQVNSAVGDIIRSFSVNHKVDLDNPDIFILVDTYKSAIAVGISRNYKKWYSDSSLPTASPQLNWSDFLTPGLPSITH